jgi:hypothetical protein
MKHFLLDDNIPDNIEADTPLEWCVHFGKFKENWLVFNRYILDESIKLYNYKKPSKINPNFSSIKIFKIFGALRKESCF